MGLEFGGQLDEYLLADCPDEHQPDDDDGGEPDWEAIAAARAEARQG